jgi:hypothetical protein
MAFWCWLGQSLERNSPSRGASGCGHRVHVNNPELFR